MEQRHICTSIEGLVAMVVLYATRHGRMWYVSGTIPADRDPTKTDEKFAREKNVSNLGMSRYEREELQADGQSIQSFLRVQVGEEWVWICQSTKGKGEFWDVEKPRDFRRNGFEIGPYRITVRFDHEEGRDRARVSLTNDTYRNELAYFRSIACQRTKQQLENEIRSLRYRSYEPIINAQHNWLRAVNSLRRKSGYKPVSYKAVRTRKRPLKAFEKEAA